MIQSGLLNWTKVVYKKHSYISASLLISHKRYPVTFHSKPRTRRQGVQNATPICWLTSGSLIIAIICWLTSGSLIIAIIHALQHKQQKKKLSFQHPGSNFYYTNPHRSQIFTSKIQSRVFFLKNHYKHKPISHIKKLGSLNA